MNAGNRHVRNAGPKRVNTSHVSVVKLGIKVNIAGGHRLKVALGKAGGEDNTLFGDAARDQLVNRTPRRYGRLTGQKQVAVGNAGNDLHVVGWRGGGVGVCVVDHEAGCSFKCDKKKKKKK